MKLTDIANRIPFPDLPVLTLEMRRHRSRMPWYIPALLCIAPAGGLCCLSRGAIDVGLWRWGFAASSFGLLAVMILLAPFYGVPAFAREREERTLDALVLTRLSAVAIADQKLASVLVLVLRALLLAMPSYAVIALYASVGVVKFACVCALLFLSCAAACALCVCVSFGVTDTRRSRLAAYALLAPCVVIPALHPQVSAVALSRSWRGVSGDWDAAIEASIWSMVAVAAAAKAVSALRRSKKPRGAQRENTGGRQLTVGCAAVVGLAAVIMSVPPLRYAAGSAQSWMVKWAFMCATPFIALNELLGNGKGFFAPGPSAQGYAPYQVSVVTLAVQVAVVAACRSIAVASVKAAMAPRRTPSGDGALFVVVERLGQKNA